jgi:hypothetical protein
MSIQTNSILDPHTERELNKTYQNEGSGYGCWFTRCPSLCNTSEL